MSDDEDIAITESLIDLSNILEGQVSGLDTETLNLVTEQSSERFLSELSDGFLNFLNDEETSERAGRWGNLEWACWIGKGEYTTILFAANDC